MTGIILDAVLMLLLVAAIGYGIRLERKLTQLRAGQLAFAGAVSELNTAAGRAENALASLRMSGEEADMLHDRIIKARALKTELEALMARAGRSAPTIDDGVAPSVTPLSRRATSPLLRNREDSLSSPSPQGDGEVDRRPRGETEGATRFQPVGAAATRPVLQALAANQAAQQSLNRARRSMDEDLFAA